MNELQFVSPESGERKWKPVFTIIESKGKNGGPDRSFWLRVGVAFLNKDGSLNVRLDAIPTNGTLHIRDQAPDEGRPRREDPARYAQKALV